MIKDTILEKLICFTDEEIDNLNGKNSIDKSIFNGKGEIDYQKLLSSDELITVRKHARFNKYPKHKHNYIEMMYVYNGKMNQIIDDNEINIKEGEVILLNKEIEHEIGFASENDIIFNFIIRPEFFDYLSSLSNDNNVIFNFILDALYSKNNLGEYLVFHSSENLAIKGLVEEIITLMYEPGFASEVKLKLLIGLMLLELMDDSNSIEAYTESGYEKLLNTSILRYVKKSYKQGSLAEVSKLLHQPDYKICRVVKKHTGYTFKQLVQEARLEKTVELLTTTNLTISEIMDKIGYENITYFYKIFKTKYSVTPSIYRSKTRV